MKKLLVFGSLVLLLGLLIVGSALPALAHNPDPDGTVAPGGITPDQPTVVRLAEVLELTPEELVSLLQAGETLSEIAAEQNISEEAVLDAILAPHVSQIELRLNYGYITQAQADAMLAEAEEHAQSLLERDFSVAGSYGSWGEMEEDCDGMMGGWGGMMGYGGRGMMGHGYGMMGGWEDSPRIGAYEDTNSGGWGSMMGRFWNNLTHWNRGGTSGGSMMGW